MTCIQNPNGSWCFVGAVPAALAFTNKDGGAPTERQLQTASHCGPGFAKLKTRTWTTREAALACAAESANPNAR